MAVLGGKWPGTQSSNRPRPTAMAAVHEGPEFVGAAEGGWGGIKAGHLIAPGAIKGMLGDGSQASMG